MAENGSNVTALATVVQQQPMLAADILNMVTGGGDLAQLSVDQRAQYLIALCRSLDLNPLSRPIELITLNGRTVPYAKKDCTDQLRKRDKISLSISGKEVIDGVLQVTARATTADGRFDEDIGAVNVVNLKGEALANATMKAHTKAKRRVTLSICGLGFLDESEIEDVGAGSSPVEAQSVGRVFLETVTRAAVPLSPEAPKESLQQIADRLVKACETAKTKEDLAAIQQEGNALPKGAERTRVLSAYTDANERARAAAQPKKAPVGDPENTGPCDHVEADTGVVCEREGKHFGKGVGYRCAAHESKVQP